jgi:hypothetical protein
MAARRERRSLNSQKRRFPARAVTTFTRDSRGQPTGSSPTKAQLKAISGLGFNQDGVAGKFDLEIKEIAAGRWVSPG